MVYKDSEHAKWVAYNVFDNEIARVQNHKAFCGD